MPSDHIKTGPKCSSHLDFELEGHLYCPGAQFYVKCHLWMREYSGTSRAVAREPFDLEGISWYQNDPPIICNKIRLTDIVPE